MKNAFKKLDDCRCMVVDICLILMFGSIFILGMFNRAEKRRKK